MAYLKSMEQPTKTMIMAEMNLSQKANYDADDDDDGQCRWKMKINFAYFSSLAFFQQTFYTSNNRNALLRSMDILQHLANGTHTQTERGIG